MVCGSGTSCGTTAGAWIGASADGGALSSGEGLGGAMVCSSGTKAGGIGSFCAEPVADSATAGLAARLSKPRATLFPAHASSPSISCPRSAGLVVTATAVCGGIRKARISSC